MNRRVKSYLEDLVVLLLVGGLIYGIYSFFFSTQENTQITENKSIIEKQVTLPKEETVQDEMEDKEDIKEVAVVNEENNTNSETTTETIEKEEKEPITKEIKEKEKTILSNDKTITTVEEFYQLIEQKIYSNISKNVNKDNITNSNSTDIRITILQDGKYEQLTFMGGNKQYFESMKSSILDVFPLKIDNSIKSNFPRYFRMTVKY